MKKINTNNLMYADDNDKRIIQSDEFNFALDKETGISVCWGKDINDSPEYDPVSPQEIIFKLEQNFNLEQHIKNFNFIANVKKRISETEFEHITDHLAVRAANNLVALSTIASVVLILDNDLSLYNLDDILSFTRYINKFKVSVIVQINTSKKITFDELSKIKLIGTSIQIKTDDDFNGDIFLKNIQLLADNGCNLSSKIMINKNTFDEVYNIIDKLPKEISMKIYFNNPYITSGKYIQIQNKFIENQLENVRISTCVHNKFNKRKPNMVMVPVDCDATRFSIYVENDMIYPCEYAKNTSGINIPACKSIHDFWFDKNINKIRKYIIENNFCKFSI